MKNVRARDAVRDRTKTLEIYIIASKESAVDSQVGLKRRSYYCMHVAKFEFLLRASVFV
jgi:hypothetical protein